MLTVKHNAQIKHMTYISFAVCDHKTHGINKTHDKYIICRVQDHKIHGKYLAHRVSCADRPRHTTNTNTINGHWPTVGLCWAVFAVCPWHMANKLNPVVNNWFATWHPNKLNPVVNNWFAIIVTPFRFLTVHWFGCFIEPPLNPHHSGSSKSLFTNTHTWATLWQDRLANLKLISRTFAAKLLHVFYNWWGFRTFVMTY